MPKPNQNFKVAELKDYIRSKKLDIRLTQKKAELIADLKKTGNWDEGKKKKTKEKSIEKAKSPPPKKTPKPKVIKEKPVEKKVEKKVEPKVEKPVEKPVKPTISYEQLAKTWNLNDIDWDEPVGVEAPSGMMWVGMPNDIRVVTWNAYDDQDMYREQYVRLEEGIFEENNETGLSRFEVERGIKIARTQGWELPRRYTKEERKERRAKKRERKEMRAKKREEKLAKKPIEKTPLEKLASAIDEEQGEPVEYEEVDNSEFEEYEEEYETLKKKYTDIVIDNREYYLDPETNDIYWDMKEGWRDQYGEFGSDNYRLLLFGRLDEDPEPRNETFFTATDEYGTEKTDITWKNARFSKYHYMRKKYEELDFRSWQDYYRPTKKEQEQIDKGINIHPEFVDKTPEDLDTDYYMENVMGDGIMFQRNIETDELYYSGVAVADYNTDYGSERIKLFPSIIEKYNLK